MNNKWQYPTYLRSKSSGLIIWAKNKNCGEVIQNGCMTDYNIGEEFSDFIFSDSNWEECPRDELPE